MSMESYILKVPTNLVMNIKALKLPQKKREGLSEYPKELDPHREAVNVASCLSKRKRLIGLNALLQSCPVQLNLTTFFANLLYLLLTHSLPYLYMQVPRLST